MLTRPDEYKTYVALCAENLLRGQLRAPRGGRLRDEVRTLMDTTLKGVGVETIGNMAVLADSDVPHLHQHNMEEDGYNGKRVDDIATACAKEAWIERIFRPTLLCLLSRMDEEGCDRTLFTQSPKAVNDGGNWTMPQGGIHRGETVLQALIREVCGEEIPSIQPNQLSNIRLEGVHDFKLPADRETRDGFGANGRYGKRYIVVRADYTGPQRLTVKRDEIAHYRWARPAEVRYFLSKIRSVKKGGIIENVIRTRGLAGDTLKTA